MYGTIKEYRRIVKMITLTLKKDHKIMEESEKVIPAGTEIEVVDITIENGVVSFIACSILTEAENPIFNDEFMDVFTIDEVEDKY